MAYHAVTDNGSAASELRTDAHDCIMVRVLGPTRIQGCGAIDPRLERGLPSDRQLEDCGPSPTAFDGADFSCARRLPGSEETRKKRAFRSNKEADEKEERCATLLKLLDKKSPHTRSPVTVVVISSDGEGDRLVESLEVKAPVGRVTGQIRTQGGQQPGELAAAVVN